MLQDKVFDSHISSLDSQTHTLASEAPNAPLQSVSQHGDIAQRDRQKIETREKDKRFERQEVLKRVDAGEREPFAQASNDLMYHTPLPMGHVSNPSHVSYPFAQASNDFIRIYQFGAVLLGDFLACVWRVRQVRQVGCVWRVRQVRHARVCITTHLLPFLSTEQLHTPTQSIRLHFHTHKQHMNTHKRDFNTHELHVLH